MLMPSEVDNHESKTWTGPEYGTKEFAIAANYEGQLQELKYQNQLLQQRIQHLEDLRTIAVQNINYLQMLVAKFLDVPETK